MPRPPARTRVASARQTKLPATEPAPKQKTASEISSDIYGVSDRELQRRHEASTATTAVAQPREQSVSSDAYGVSDRELKRRTSARHASATSAPRVPSTTKAQERALQDAQRRRDEAMGRLDNLTSTSSDQPETLATQVNQQKSSTTTRQRKMPDASGLDIMDDDEVFGDMDTDFDDPDLDSPPPGHSTNTSSLNLSVFKRGRSRQSSIVGRDDAPIRPSSRGPNTPGLSSTFNLGRFKRRPREPSILGTSRRDQSGRPESAAASEQEDEGEAVFAPDAESTPFARTRSRRGASGAREASLPPVHATRQRKRKSDESHGGPSKRRVEQSDIDLRDSIEVSSSSPHLQARDALRPTTPKMSDSVLAPPASSGSSAASPFMLPSLTSLAHGRRPTSRAQKTPAPDDDASDISSPPSLTHSPNYRAPQAAVKAKGGIARRNPTPVTTATLTSLLPQRRRKVRNDEWDMDSDEEIDTSALGNDDDELAASSRRARKAVRALAPHSSGTAQASKAKATKSARRKYGSRNFSDKENQGGEGDSIEVAQDSLSPLPDDTFDSPEADETTTTLDVADELKKAARKFKDVDRWELSFEEVTRSSSPTGAR